MVDQSTNRQSVRNLSQKPLPSHKHSSQSLSPSQQSTRVTRSRSRDVLDAQAREPIPSRKRRKMADDEEIVVNSSTQANKVRKRGARSKHLQGNNPQVHLALSDEGWRAISSADPAHYDSNLFGSTRAFSILSCLLRLGF